MRAVTTLYCPVWSAEPAGTQHSGYVVSGQIKIAAAGSKSHNSHKISDLAKNDQNGQDKISDPGKNGQNKISHPGKNG